MLRLPEPNVEVHRREDHIAVHKLRMNEPLTPADLSELQRILAESGIGSSRSIERAKAESEGLGLFVRSLIGLDRAAAKAAFGQFTEGKVLTGNQLEFINLIVDHLTDRGVIMVEALYSSPYTDVSPQGPDGLFKPNEVDQLVDVLHEIRERAVA
jgi:type I restriction enzyme R subunit